MGSRIKGYIIYSSFFFFCFSVFIYVLFPFDQMKDFVISKVLENRQLQVSKLKMKSLRPYMLTGVKVDGLDMVRSGSMGEQRYKVESATAKISITSAIKILMNSGIMKMKITDRSINESISKHLSMQYYFKAFGGEGVGEVNFTDAKHITFEAGKLNLGKMDFLGPLLGGGKYSGIIKQVGVNIVTPDGKANTASGNILLNLVNGSLSGVKIVILSLPFIKINSLDVKIKAKNGNLVFSKFAISGDLDGKISGSIKLEPNLIYSKLKLKVNLKPSESVIKNLKALINTFIKPDHSGIYNFELEGTLGMPQLKR